MIRIGIIGAGPNAEGHARYYRESPRTHLVAIADPDAARADRLAGELNARSVRDYREFLDHVDAVVVSSPNFLHYEHAVACAEAGKHLFCEKPMGLGVDEARGIAQAVSVNHVASQVGFSVRFGGEVQTMLRMHREGELGDLISLTSRRLCYIDPAKSGWRSDHRLSGGLLYEINIHELDWMMALGGRVTAVYARTWAQNPVDERSNDHLWVTLSFAGRATGTHEGSWLSANPNFYRSCEGTKSGLCTDEWGVQLFHAPRGGNRVEIAKDPNFDLRGNFLDVIEGKAPAVADARWGLEVMRVAEAVIESARRGHPIDLTHASDVEDPTPEPYHLPTEATA